MQIGSATPYVAPLPSAQSARTLSSDESVAALANRRGAMPDAASVAGAAVTPGQSAQLRDEREQPADSATPTSSTASEDAEADEPSAASQAQQQRQEQLDIAELAGRDREVRAHEQAHSAVGGAYAGSPTYSLKRGPDGRSYAVGGEVSVDVSPIPNDPEATLRKMEVVQRAALAPADPSAQDRRIAAQAAAQAGVARGEIVQRNRDEAAAVLEERRARNEAQREEQAASEEEDASQQSAAPAPSLDLYRNLAQLQEPVAAVDLLA
ncbi:hypothetical protein A9179_01865 [Pseudomonas alcaligenes]|uniref:SprA-related family protein n=2 Tax=Aquipseudomonas alcaligenes TaxID=43263 RepID=A0ABR7RY01_AQUAC|nr:hypothetical protein [Pseudomonas alcaligenes]